MQHLDSPPAYDINDNDGVIIVPFYRNYICRILTVVVSVLIIIFIIFSVNTPESTLETPESTLAPSPVNTSESTLETSVNTHKKIINISFTELYVTHANAHFIMSQRGGIMYDDYSVFTSTLVNTDATKSVESFINDCGEPRGRIIRFNLEYFLNSNKLSMINIITTHFQHDSYENRQVFIEVEDSELQYEYRTNGKTLLVQYWYNKLFIISVHRENKICTCGSPPQWNTGGCKIDDFENNGFYKTIAIFQIKK
jgi:hypothetical protein